MAKRIVLSILLLFLMCGCSKNEIAEDSTFEIRFFEVGHGDAALVMCDGHNMMIDCGSSSNDTGIQSMFYDIDNLNIDRFDYIFVSHPDKDHYSLFKDILEDRKVGRVFCSTKSGDVDNKYYNIFEDSFKTFIKRIEIPKKEKIYKLGSAEIEILAINEKEYSKNNSNDTSIVLMITYGETKFLFTGDAGEYTEKKILKNLDEKDRQKDLECDVIKIAHHGSNTSSTYEFLKAAMKNNRPLYAIISAGKDDQFDKAKDNMDRLGITYFRTDEKGTITCTSDGKKVKIESKKEGKLSK